MYLVGLFVSRSYRASLPLDLVCTLNEEQRTLRRRHGFHQRTATSPSTDHQRRLAFLSRLWDMNYNILQTNFDRLISLASTLALNRLRRFSSPFDDEYLGEDEYSVALELFLQIDIGLFYMKTCSYRGAKPVVNETSVFCSHEPSIEYSMTRCNRHSCCLCYPSYQLVHRLNTPVVHFGPNQQHDFVNGYRSILNCPATCETRNIIYALTCPCKQFDYIGETSSSLPTRLTCQLELVNKLDRRGFRFRSSEAW
jgi:hypothetical protein